MMHVVTRETSENALPVIIVRETFCRIFFDIDDIMMNVLLEKLEDMGIVITDMTDQDCDNSPDVIKIILENKVLTEERPKEIELPNHTGEMRSSKIF